MDRTYPHPRRRRRLAALLTTALLAAGPWPAAYGRSPTPILSDEPAGDPGDGVLRPADISPTPPPSSPPEGSTGGTTTTTTAATTATTPAVDAGAWFLVPCVNPAGQPWLTFRLVRVDRSAVSFAGAAAGGGRWHRAP